MTNLDKKQALGMPTWVDLMTDDPEAARKFYGTLFGWSFDVGGPESGHYTICEQGGRPVGGIGLRPQGAAYANAWTLYLAVDDIDATCTRISEASGRVTMPPTQVMDAGKLAIVQEPTGATFGLWQPGARPGFALRDAPGSFAWTELNTRDLPRAQRFLETVFGYRAEKMQGMEYMTLHLGDITAGGILQMDKNWPSDLPPHWMLYFAVTSTDATVSTVTSLGGTLHVPPFDTPYGRMSVVADPQKSVFSVIQLKTQ